MGGPDTLAMKLATQEEIDLWTRLWAEGRRPSSEWITMVGPDGRVVQILPPERAPA